MVHLYYLDDSINLFAIGYMINPSLQVNNVFREQVEKFLNDTFHKKTMETKRYGLKKKNTCFIAQIVFKKIM